MAKYTSETMRRLRMRILRLMKGSRLGSYGTRKRTDSGIEFDNLREYTLGDDVRNIDWKSSARSHKLMTRSYREQQNRTVVLLVDTSISLEAGSGGQLKAEMVQEIALLLHAVAEMHGDALGLLTAGTSVLPLPARHGKEHYRLVASALETLSLQDKPSWQAASRELMRLVPKHAIVFVLTDGIVANLENYLAPLAQRHAVMMFRILDPHERIFPAAAVTLRDPESSALVALSSSYEIKALQAWVDQWLRDQERILSRLGVRICDLTVGEPYETKICNFLQQGI